MHRLMLSCDAGGAMRTTVTIDDKLLEEAKWLTGIQETSCLIRAALTALVQQESARRLAKLGGSEPQLEDVPRRRQSAWSSWTRPCGSTISNEVFRLSPRRSLRTKSRP